jgi:hypothetical protein
MNKFVLFTLLLISTFGVAQRDNTFYAKSFYKAGGTVGSAVAAAQSSCINDVTIKCFIVIDSTLEAYPVGTLPAPCAQCVFLDYRSGIPGASSGAPTNDSTAKRFHVQDTSDTDDFFVILQNGSQLEFLDAANNAFSFAWNTSGACPTLSLPLGYPNIGQVANIGGVGVVVPPHPNYSYAAASMDSGCDTLAPFTASALVFNPGPNGEQMLMADPTGGAGNQVYKLPNESACVGAPCLLATQADVAAAVGGAPAYPYRSGVSTSTASSQTIDFSDAGGSCFTTAAVIQLSGIGGSVNETSYNASACTFTVATAGVGFNWTVTAAVRVPE